MRALQALTAQQPQPSALVRAWHLRSPLLPHSACCSSGPSGCSWRPRKHQLSQRQGFWLGGSGLKASLLPGMGTGARYQLARGTVTYLLSSCLP